MTLLALCSTTVAAQEPQKRDPNIIGEAFGKPVTAREFHYYLITSSIFTRTGIEDRDEEEVRAEAWQNLVYRHEAGELGVTVSNEELKEQLTRLMAEKDVEYGTDAYRMWPQENLREDTATFERRIEDLLIVNKFLSEKGNPEITVTEDEMLQKFKNQYNSFESEYINFDTEDEAKEHAKKFTAKPALWKEMWDEKKPLGQKGASWINTMSLEALIDLWKIPKEDAYRILEHENGNFIPAKYFYGNAVFRLLQKKEADMEKYDEKKKEYYKNTMTMYRKRSIAKEYFEDLFKRAGYKDFVWQERQAQKIDGLKSKSSLALETNHGIIELELFCDKAPYACENFIGLVEKGYYDGILFHRVIKDFMIQGGDPTATGTGGESIWGKPFVDEVSDDLTFDKPGILAMANSGPNTNQSQFFITTKETPWLNKKHTIFGHVISGYDVVEKIEELPVDAGKKPTGEAKIIKAYIKNKD
ncbi:MAG: peptidylprolyl isomerase [Candidatus Omnitrophota bacterium]